MKKLSISILFLLFSSLFYSADINVEIKNTAKFQNLSTDPFYTLENSAKLNFKSKGDNYYGELSAKAIYNPQSTQTGTVVVDRAYTEFYKDDLSLSIGKQRLAWGTGYIFNYADLFNPINFSDPKGEKEGINCLTQKLNIGDTAKVESAQIFQSAKHIDYGARTSFTLGNFELTANYIKNQLQGPLQVLLTQENYIAEFRGEFEIGVWGSAAYVVNMPSKNFINSYSVKKYTLGADYTIDLFGNTLYRLEETSYNDSTYVLTYFGQIRLTPSEDYNIMQTVTVDSAKFKQMYSSVINYTINDFITSSITYNRYIKTDQYFSDNANSEYDVTLTVKTNF